MTLLSGKTIRPLFLEELKKERETRNISFFLYSAKEDFSAQAYLRGIKKMLDSLSIPYVEDFLDLSKSEEENLSLFQEHSKGKMILLARPLKVPYEKKFLALIGPDQDPDMFHPENVGRLYQGDLNYLPATAASVREIISFYKIPTEGKRAVILGRSNEVGYPCFALLNKLNATVSLLHSKTEESVKEDLVRNADILVLATGKSGLVKREWLSPKCVILDCGFSAHGGDLGFVPKEGEVAAYTPVPGGVGALTSLCLVKNAFFLSNK